MKVNNDGCHVTKKSTGCGQSFGCGSWRYFSNSMERARTFWVQYSLLCWSCKESCRDPERWEGREGGKEGEREHIIMHENSNTPTILIIIIMPANLPQTPFSPKILYPKQLLRFLSHCLQTCAYPLRLAMHYIHTHTHTYITQKLNQKLHEHSHQEFDKIKYFTDR